MKKQFVPIVLGAAFFVVLLNDLKAQNVFPSTGNVGIGTTSPAAPLEIATSDTNKVTAVLARLVEGNTVGSGTYLGVRTGKSTQVNTLSFALEHYQSGNLNNAVNFYRGGNVIGGYMAFATNDGTECMLIDPNGNVGIGTSAPASKLAVNGTITAQKVKIIVTGWPDYVFDSSYKVMSLEGTENYIKTEKHLPEIPAADVIEKEGLDVAEMQKLTMKKVEELTLLLIQMKKENDAVKVNNEAIRQQIEQLKAALQPVSQTTK